jgi:hypothetical protein
MRWPHSDRGATRCAGWALGTGPCEIESRAEPNTNSNCVLGQPSLGDTGESVWRHHVCYEKLLRVPEFNRQFAAVGFGVSYPEHEPCPCLCCVRLGHAAIRRSP